jgi:hypothetical protein
MLTFFRRFFQSKIGLPIFFGFLVLMALAFVAADISGTSISGVSGTDNIAVVGDEPIPNSELVTAANTALEQVRQQNPTLLRLHHHRTSPRLHLCTHSTRNHRSRLAQTNRACRGICTRQGHLLCRLEYWC